jgi:hypothetical protein
MKLKVKIDIEVTLDYPDDYDDEVFNGISHDVREFLRSKIDTNDTIDKLEVTKIN